MIIIDYQNKKIREFFKFCLVGLLCTAIDASVFYILVGNIGYKISMICGFCVSIIVNYLLNILWAFQTKPNWQNAIGVFSAHCFNIFIVRMTLMWIFINLIFLTEEQAFIPTIILSVITNFIIVRFIINKSQPKQKTGVLKYD